MDKKFLLTNNTIGIIGGGQLGRMMALAAKAMGYRIIVLDPTADCPAAQVSDEQIVADYDDKVALRELSEKADVVTYEFENIDYDALKMTQNLVSVPQGSELLSITQDRILEKAYLESANINIAPYAVIVDKEEIESEIKSIGYPAVLKTAQGGYDGKGQVVLHDANDIDTAARLLRYGSCVLEAWIPFEKEISIVVARNLDGQVETFPVAENVHVNNILHTTIAPANVTDDVHEEAEEIAKKLADVLQLCGVLAVEMFVTNSGAIYVNELAPRPHNSGHFTIEACSISQFTQHIRAIVGLPLVKPELLKPAVMINILGQHVEAVNEHMAEYAQWFVHYYGKKEAKINRKMGHITVLTDEPKAILSEIEEMQIWK
ncbi:5-(carboxyamino)imidazole ribonucleotide synthase [Listeria welshimeri]|uniref:5-(carboxyamino)imidazole ribonucleotide synthase n=1 Tax=Listeria welshimeri TaxID=1643 RepID=UPI0016255A7F|nr:5-(carboxyamino)imidazole ribonucleotide synthase [Listeria welshimeri]MBC1250370.1 5-(carboxyamino)imidazole ribonucleotide synthase [Listeria welshimeri]MBC1631522.1 5-(carboxyamino)imidazole ribonucleotide synthase [Listeria welshimeri]MBC2016633.1 5-(carboxyamino)imidazole ribonucleotide synthase [Listeria welshimeri]MBC6126978.1 5-(carboxyamino)imidazole ribonucleotide synthase [Listeria welshimeri]MBC6141625.1 5-(carboxyamino)imidazole ribonucleotide synthase [Listeria welshimeri]